jgi:hypothetical protein
MGGPGIPFRIEGIDGVRDEGKEDNDACRLRLLLPLAVVPLVDGRYGRTDAMMLEGNSESHAILSNISLAKLHRVTLCIG